MTSVAELRRGLGPARRTGRPRRRRARCGARSRLRGQLGDPPVGVVEVEQPRGGVLGPGQHVLDGLAVLAGQRDQRRPALGDRGQPGRVGVQAGGVRRHVGGHVGEQVADLGEPVGEPGRLGVVLAHPVEQLAGGGDGAERVGTAVLGGQALAGLLGGGAQGVREAEPGLLGGRGRASSPGCGSTASTSPSPKRSRSASRARSRADCDDVGELGLGRRAARRSPRPNRARSASAFVAGEAVERRRAARPGCSSRCWSDWPCTATSGSASDGQRGDRDRGAAGEGPGAALGARSAGPARSRPSSTSPPTASTARQRGVRPARADATRPSTRAGARARADGAGCRRGRRAAGRAR